MTPDEQEREEREETRLHALRSLGVLDTPPDPRFDLIVRVVQQVFDVPMAGVTFIDADRQWTKAAAGPVGREVPRDQSFCAHAVDDEATLVVPDATLDARFANNVFVAGDPGIRAYAGVPLLAPGGQAVGALCAIDDRVREFTPEQLRLLTDLARWVDIELARERELRQAADVQRRLVPPALTVPGYELAGVCQMAGDLGGDFFDWQPVHEGVQAVVGDVMGKGIAAAMLSASVRAVVRGAALFGDLAAAMQHAAYALDRDLTETRVFVTMALLRVDTADGAVSYVDAGHGLAGIVARDGTMRPLAGAGLPLGVLPDSTWEAGSERLAPGETLIAFTDGLLDHFPTTEETIAAVAREVCRAGSAREAANRVVALAREVSDDDLTIVAIHREASP